jgi:hypothetical protein
MNENQELQEKVNRLVAALREIADMTASSTRYDSLKGAAKMQEIAMNALTMKERVA